MTPTSSEHTGRATTRLLIGLFAFEGGVRSARVRGRERYRLYQATKVFEAVYGPVDSSEQATEGSGKA